MAKAAPGAAVNRYTGPPMTLGAAASARVRLIVWCRDCRHQVEPDPAEMAQRYGAELSVPDWHQRLVCSGCGSLARAQAPPPEPSASIASDQQENLFPV
jgi:hypothetical protein